MGHNGAVAAGWLLGAAVTTVSVIVSGAPGSLASDGVTPGAIRPAAETTIPAPTSTTTAPPPAPTTTTVPARQASIVVTTTPPPAPAPAPAPAPSKHGILPPQEPPANIPPSPNFLQSCQGTTYDDSATCVNATLSAIANARAKEGLAGMVLPSNWAQLSVEEQLYVATNLERTARGLPPLSAMAVPLDQASAQGAASNADPSPPSGYPYTQWGSNWAGAVGNPLEAIYYWMYDDGLGSSNIDCTQSDQTGCWGHRDNVLLDLRCTECYMGTGYSPTAWNGDPSLAEILVDTSGSQSLQFTWAQEQPYLS